MRHKNSKNAVTLFDFKATDTPINVEQYSLRFIVSTVHCSRLMDRILTNAGTPPSPPVVSARKIIFEIN